MNYKTAKSLVKTNQKIHRDGSGEFHLVDKNSDLPEFVEADAFKSNAQLSKRKKDSSVKPLVKSTKKAKK